MLSLLRRLFLENWLRKLVALLLAIALWLIVHFSMTSSKTLDKVSVRVINLPSNTTVEGMLQNGVLEKKIPLTITGNKHYLEEVDEKNLEVVLDAAGKPSSWIASISKQNLLCLNPEISLDKAIAKIVPQEIVVQQSVQIEETIPVLVAEPLGEPPKGYHFIDLWPTQFSLPIKGPEGVVKKLRRNGVMLTLDLKDVSKRELDILSQTDPSSEEVRFFVPNSWKKVSIPQLSDTPIDITDPLAKSLRLNFSKQALLPLSAKIPVSIFCSPRFHKDSLTNYTLQKSPLLEEQNGMLVLKGPLFVDGVSHFFLEAVKDMLQIVVVAEPHVEGTPLLWNVQFIYPHELENRYISRALLEMERGHCSIPSPMREDYLRLRFRSFMRSFRLFDENRKKLSLEISALPEGIYMEKASQP